MILKNNQKTSQGPKIAKRKAKIIKMMTMLQLIKNSKTENNNQKI